MTYGQLKGALLEYLIRRLLSNCGFTSAKPDGHYVFAQSGNGLFYVNGKGAAHDADVLMEPPIQMPFSYPSRLLFECKAHKRPVGLTVIRNALGLRYDINEFEIVDDASIIARKNNHRANYAISNRKRYNYQIGVASVEHFSKPAFEFAANNKIPLISLRWFLSDRICDLFHNIDKDYLNSINGLVRENLYTFLKDKDKNALTSDVYRNVFEFFEQDETIGEIVTYFNAVVNRSYVGLLESGDLIFLFANQSDSFELLRERVRFSGLRAQIYYYPDVPNVWELELLDRSQSSSIERNPEFKFFVPDRIMKQWREFGLDKNVALDLKQEFFSRIFIFTNRQEQGRLPFFVVTMDRDWLERQR